MILNLFSKRQKMQRGEIPDVFSYDSLPEPLRVQIVHILTEAIGKDLHPYLKRAAEGIYEFVHKSLCREIGVFKLGRTDDSNDTAVINYFLNEKNVERALDVIELFFRIIDRSVREDPDYHEYTGSEITPDDAISELNARFKEHGVGYEYQSGEIIRVDSKLIHETAVKPALVILRASMFAGANEEFLKAHEHYRHGRSKEAIAGALKSLESVLKAICKKRKWTHDPNDTAKTLLEVCFRNGLIPPYLESHYSALRSTLDSGVPTIRNKTAGHGQGPVPVDVPEYLVRYVIHLVASAILFLAEADQTTR